MKRTPSAELDALLDAIGPDCGPLDDDPALLDVLARGETPEGADPALWAPFDDEAVARMTRAAMAARDAAPSVQARSLRTVAEAAAKASPPVVRERAASRLWAWLRSPVAGLAVALAAAVLLWPSPPAALPAYVLEAGVGDRVLRGSDAAQEGPVTVSDGSVYRLVLRPQAPVADVAAAVFLRGPEGWRPLSAQVDVAPEGAVRVALEVDAQLPVGDVTFAVVIKPREAPTVDDVGKESTWEVVLRHVPQGAGPSSP